MTGFVLRKSGLLHSGVAALGIATALCMLPEQALAQDKSAEADNGGLSEIVVTAQRREENLRDVPISVHEDCSLGTIRFAVGVS